MNMPSDSQPPSDPALASVSGYASYSDVYLDEAVVASVLRRGGNAEDCVVALANMKAQLLARVMELEAIAPKKIKTPDGKVYVWHCPTDLIPEA